MNITVNQLPTRTWNRLAMNEAQVALEGDFERLEPQVLQQPQNVLWQTAGQDLGISGDLTELLQDIAPAAASANTEMSQPLVLRYHLEAGRQAAAKLCLEAENKALLKVALVLDGEADGTLALQVEVKAQSDTRVELYMANLLSDRAKCLNHVAASCEDRSKFSLIRLELGAKKLYSGVNVDLAGQESSFYTDIGYHTLGGQSMDMNYVSAHRGKKTECLMEISGTLEEKARKTFRGTIDFQRGCAGAKGTENENVLLMGDTMVNQTLPVILCQEEDVEGNHGASIGQLDDKVLFYLGSRGISQEEAKQMIAQARIQAVCLKFPSEEVRKMVHLHEDGRGICHGEL